MATGSDIRTRLHNRFANKTADLTTTLVLAYINTAIRHGFPHFKQYKRDEDVVTLAASTYIYSLAAITDTLPSWGVSRVYVTSPHDEPSLRLQAVQQFEDSGTWKLRMPARVVAAYAGQGVHVEYQTTYDELTAITEELPVDEDYVYFDCCVQYAERLEGSGHTASVKLYERILYGHNNEDSYIERALKRKVTQGEAAVSLPLYQPPVHTRSMPRRLMGE